MKEGWHSTSLKDICDKITVGFVGTMSNYFVNDGVPLLRGQNIKPYRLDMSNLKFIPNEIHKKWEKSSLNNGDVVIVRVGYPGTACVIPAGLGELNAASLVILRPIRNKLDSHYLSYVLNSPWGKATINGLLVGSAQQVFNTNTAADLAIPLPPLLIQKKISSILSSYNKLIENNTRRIQILEEMAQRIYKEWFVDFKYPGHENDKLVDSELGMIPEGWEVGCVSDYYDVRSGFAFKSKDMVKSGDYGIVKIKNIQSDGLKLDSTQYISEELIQERAYNFELIENDLLIAMTGAQVGKVGLMPKSKDKYLLNQRVGKFFPKAEFETNNMFMYQLTKSNNFQTSVVNIAQGAAQPNISGTQIGSIQFPAPSMELIQRYEEICNSIKDQVLLLNYKNQILRQTRDLLLPKLISGKIDVSDLDIEIGET
jgi:type I restriction enzyme, S subunit